MATTNDITGDKIKTGANSQKYVDNWAGIFAKNKPKKDEKPVAPEPKK